MTFSSMIDCELPDQRKGTNPKKKLFATKGEKNVVHAVVAQLKSEQLDKAKWSRLRTKIINQQLLWYGERKEEQEPI